MAPTGAAPGDNFSLAVGTAGDMNGDGYADVLVGAPNNDAGGMDAGRAYVFFGGPSPDTTADLILTGVAAGDHFGQAVRIAGDVNRDGFADIIVGAPANGIGRAYIFFGGPSPDATADVILTGVDLYDNFGASVGTAGDVNGDGYADVIVGAGLNDAAGLDAGRAYVYYGGPDPDPTPDLVFTGAAVGDEFGVSVRTAGDVNGDGFADMIVGADLSDAGGEDAGRAYVFFGGQNPDTLADLLMTGEAPGDSLGVSASAAGDVNDDGFADMVMGAHHNDAGGHNAGRAYVFFGGPNPDATPDLVFTAEAANDHLGFCVDTAGDINHDGFSDVIVGADLNDVGGLNAGRAYVFYGGTSADTIADLKPTGAGVGDKFGGAVGYAGDVDADGFSEVIVGGVRNDEGGIDAGRAYVFGDHPCVDVEASRPGLATTLFLAPWPNPASTETRMAFQLERASRVTVTVHDIAGRTVAHPMVEQLLPAGRSFCEWRPTGLPRGVYVLDAKVGSRVERRHLVWLGDR